MMNAREKAKKQQKYSIVYADPPWNFKCWSPKATRTAEKHYKVMSIDAIKSIPVYKITNDNAVLLMWVTSPLLEKAFEVIDSWGFTYKTCAFTWAKKNKKSDSWFWGLGYYTRSNAEICLLATKGKGLPRQSKSVHSIIDTPIEKHSQKPDVARDRIVELFGDVPRIELFARQRAEGWDSLGNEIDGQDIQLAIKRIIRQQRKGA